MGGGGHDDVCWDVGVGVGGVRVVVIKGFAEWMGLLFALSRITAATWGNLESLYSAPLTFACGSRRIQIREARVGYIIIEQI